MKNRIHITRGQVLLLIYFALVSLVILLVCTRSSFLYPLNNWDDANSYFSMGKSMLRGKVIYRDLFDQKGPYLYFLYGLASLISYTTFKGVFLLEILLGILDLVLMYKVLRLFLSQRTSLFLVPFVFAVMFSSYCFYWGGAAEEICMPALLYALYMTVRNFPGLPHGTNTGKAIRPYTRKEIFTTGLVTGLVLCTKFTLLGFFFTFMMFVFLSSWNREDGTGLVSFVDGAKRFLLACVIFLAGMFLPAVPWLIYFGIHGAIGDWYNVYIYTNVFLYSSWGANDSGDPWSAKIANMITVLKGVFDNNLQYFAFIVLGALYGLVRRGAGLWSRFAIPMFYVFTALAIYIGGGRLPYYAIPFMALTVLGFVPVGLVLEYICGKIGLADTTATTLGAATPEHAVKIMGLTSRLATVAFCLGAVLLSLLIVWHQSMNTYYMSYSKEDMFQTQFAADIAADGLKNPTLLNYNCLDCGLYTSAGIVPTCYWFQSQTLPEPDVMEIQKDYYRNHEVDYVVYRGDDYPESLTENYDLIDSFHQVMNSETFSYPEFNYYLFRLKGIMD